MTFAKIIRTQRKAKGWSAGDLASKLGKTPGYLSRIEVQGEIPAGAVILQLARLLELNADLLKAAAKQDKLEQINKRAAMKIDNQFSDAIQEVLDNAKKSGK